MNYNVSEKAGVSTREDEDGTELMANFAAFIVTETSYLGGIAPDKTVTLKGFKARKEGEPEDLPEITMSDAEFIAMNWPMKHWGSKCIVYPISGVKDDLRTAIQLASEPTKSAIYGQTGWVELPNNEWAYLHRGGGVTKAGNDPGITVHLPNELRYDLATDVPAKEAIAATFELISVCSPDVTWPLLAATICPMYGMVDFAVHVTGRTGSFKSELAALFQSHYGPEMDSRHLPANWSSSDNAIEAMAFLACNALMVIDDFVPTGPTYQQRAYQAKAERIFRAQGNQAGRQRLTDISRVQNTMYPRGCVFSTGEDTPEGHSVRGRMMIREIKQGDITAEDLTKAQANRKKYCGTMLWLAQQLATAELSYIDTRAESIRDANRDVGHGRTPAMMGRMIAVCEDFINRCVAAKFLTAAQATAKTAHMVNSITVAAKQQASFLENSDPVEIFFATIRQMFAAGTAHVKSVSGGVPMYADLLGWVAEGDSEETEMRSYKARGQVIGWVSAKRGELYLEPNAAITLAKKVAGPEIPLSKPTLMKRIAEGGYLLRSETNRGRLTARVSAGQSVKDVMVLKLQDVIDTESQKKSVDE